MNTITKTWEGHIVDTHNNLHVVEVSVGYRSMEAGNSYVVERHGRTDPVLVTSTIWNAMQKACSLYNKKGF